MAEILIQRKRRRSVRPWLLGLVVLALLPLPFLANRGEQRTVARQTPRRDTTTRVVASAPDSAASQVPGAGVAATTGAAQGASARATPGVSGGASASAPSGARPATTGPATAQPATSEVATARGSEPPRAASERTTATSAGTIAPTEPTRPASRPSTSRASGSGSPPSAPTSSSPSSDRASFSTFTATTKAPTNERAHREYTADALDRLAAELRTLGATEAGVSVIRTHADSLRMANARGAARPDYARAAFLGAVRQFDLLRGRSQGRVNVARLRSAAWAIDTRRPLVAQRPTVERFFAAARDALESLSRRS